MQEINPILAGTFSAPEYAPAASNINRPALDIAETTKTAAIDSRRYTKFDRTAMDAGETTDFSFGDLLDLINPLEHIPGVSTLYRAMTGERIHPVSQVAGDILFGGVFGLASALIGGVSSVVDVAMQQETGKDSTEHILATLFGPDDEPATQLASAATDAIATATVAPELPPTLASVVAPPPTIAPAINGDEAVAVLTSLARSPDNQLHPLTAAKGFPLDRTKQAYGGVMAPANSLANNIEAQDRIIALSEGSRSMRLGNTIYTNRLMNGAKPMALAARPIPVVAPAPVTPMMPDIATGSEEVVSSIKVTPVEAPLGPRNNPIPQALIDDMIMLKALDQYKSMAAGPRNLGTSVDVTN